MDRHGRLGVFTTGGAGPIPKALLRSWALLDKLVDAVRALPITSDCMLFASVPRPDDFIAFARRGLFSFDWTGAHRTGNSLGVYAIQARPSRPLFISATGWPPELLDFLRSMAHGDMDFDASSIDVAAVLDCCGPDDAPTPR